MTVFRVAIFSAPMMKQNIETYRQDCTYFSFAFHGLIESNRTNASIFREIFIVKSRDRGNTRTKGQPLEVGSSLANESFPPPINSWKLRPRRELYLQRRVCRRISSNTPWNSALVHASEIFFNAGASNPRFPPELISLKASIRTGSGIDGDDEK